MEWEEPRVLTNFASSVLSQILQKRAECVVRRGPGKEEALTFNLISMVVNSHPN